MKNNIKKLFIIIFSIFCNINFVYAESIIKIEGDKYIKGNDKFDVYITFAQSEESENLPTFSALDSGTITLDKDSNEQVKSNDKITLEKCTTEFTKYRSVIGEKITLIPYNSNLVTFNEKTKKIRIAKCTFSQNSGFKAGDQTSIYVKSREGSYIVPVSGYTTQSACENAGNEWDSTDGSCEKTISFSDDAKFTITKYSDEQTIGSATTTISSNSIKNSNSDDIIVTYEMKTTKDVYIAYTYLPIIYDNQVLSLEKIESMNYFASPESVDDNATSFNTYQLIFFENYKNSGTAPFEILKSKTSVKMKFTFKQIGFATESSTKILFGNSENTTFYNSESNKDALLEYIDSSSLTVTKTDKTISLDPKTVSLSIGESKKVTVNTSGLDESDEITWSKVDGVDVTDNNDGTITLTAKKEGNYTIKGTIESGSVTISASVDVSVSSVTKSISFVPETVSLNVGDSQRVTINTTGMLSDEKINFECTNDGIEVVDNNDRTITITGKKIGEYTITASTEDNAISKTLEVSVGEQLSGSIKNSKNILINDTITLSFTTNKTLTDAEKKQINWEVSGDTTSVKLETIDANDKTSVKITGIAKGTVIVTAKLLNCTASTTISIDTARLTDMAPSSIQEGQKKKITYSINSKTVTVTTWTSSNEEIATVSSDGYITGIKESGESVMICGILSDGGASCFFVNVTAKNKVELNTSNITKNVGEEFIVEATTNSTGIKKWESSNSDVALLYNENNGKITVKALTVGTSTITVTDNNNETDFFVLTVISNTNDKKDDEKEDDRESGGGSSSGGSSSGESSDSSQTITFSNEDNLNSNLTLVLNPSSKQVVVGESFSIYASTNAVDKTVEWTIDNKDIITYTTVGNEIKITANYTGTVNITAKIGDKSATSAITITSSDQNAVVDNNNSNTSISDSNNPHTGIAIPSMMVSGLSVGLISTTRQKRKHKKVFKI